MAYKPNDDINGILNEKKAYKTADEAGDKTAAEQARERAKRYYDRLSANGYGTVLNNLSQKNYENAQKYINNYYAKTGRVNPREYFKQKAKGWGLDENDINSKIGYDSTTGEVSFAGKNIGVPEATADNKSYYKSDYLDGVWNDYIKENGISRSDEQLAGLNSEEVREKINSSFDTAAADREYLISQNDKYADYTYNHNPYDTDIGRSIMEDFNYQGRTASGDALADGAAQNGGNIDSFSAANAARQQLAYTSAGKKAVLEDFNTRLAGMRERLSDLGVQLKDVRADQRATITLGQQEAQRLTENAENKKLNAQSIENDKTDNLAKRAEVTGYVPNEWAESSDPVLGQFLNADGTIKAEFEGVDFQNLINKAKANGNTELARKYAILRGKKIWNNYQKFGIYAGEGDIEYSTPQETEARREFNEKIAAGDRALDIDYKTAVANNQSAEKINTANNQNALDQITTAAEYTAKEPTLTTTEVNKAIENGEVSPSVIEAYNYYYGTNYSVDNPPTASGEVLTSGTNTDMSGWETFMSYFPEKEGNKDREKTRAFLIEQLKPYYDRGDEITEDTLEKLIVGDDVKKSNSTQYDLDVNEVKSICNALGLDARWVDNYKNRWGFNSGKGMKNK